MSSFAPWDEARAAGVLAPFIGREGGLLPALHEIQGVFGHVPEQAVPILAHAFNLSRADVHGTISFYHEFRRAPPGRAVLRLCRAEACQSCGGAAVADEVLRRLGTEWGGTTGDGGVTVEPVFCLGLCAVAPAALIDGTPVGRISAEALIEALR